MDIGPPPPRRKRTQPSGCTQPDGRVQNPAETAIGYVRVSTEEQAKFGVSLDAQSERIRGYAAAQGLALFKIVQDDGVSGAKKFETRPGGSEVLAILKSGRAHHLIALKLDRLFRDAEDALGQSRSWDRTGTALHVIDMGGSSMNTASPMGRMFLTMAAAFAELERNLIAERTASSLRHKKQSLKVYSPTPYGFTRSGSELTENTEERETVDRIREMNTRGWSLRAIAEKLNSNGIPTKKGGRWYASTIQKILGNSIHQK